MKRKAQCNFSVVNCFYMTGLYLTKQIQWIINMINAQIVITNNFRKLQNNFHKKPQKANIKMLNRLILDTDEIDSYANTKPSKKIYFNKIL